MSFLNKCLQNLLVVNDSEDRRNELAAALTSAGYSVESGDVASIVRLIGTRGLLTGLVILDIEQSGGSSLQLIEQLRNANPRIGIVVISSLCRTEDRLFAYRNGADIYLQSKPGDARESEVLIAAVNGLADRVFQQQPIANNIVLDVRTLQLHGFMATVNISAHESLILSAFVNAIDLRLETQRLVAITSNEGAKSSKSTLEVQLVRLRKKLALVGADSPTIKSLRGFGYQLCAPVTVTRAGTR